MVFPEDGIHGIAHSREGVKSYLEYIPDPEKEKWNPCQRQKRYDNSEIQHALSCMAKRNRMYVVANMGDYQPCNKADDKKCPEDGQYQFNTDVVYDPTGLLIAKYHKINLYYEYMYDYPPDRKRVYFDTPFGRFGIMTCFDILFKDPIIGLLEKDGIGNVVFPTAWMDSLPLLAAIQFHSAFAAGVNVNFLSANIKYSKRRFHGSGIFTPKGYASFFYSEDSKGKLLVSDIGIIRRRKIGNIPNKKLISKEFKEHNNKGKEFKAKIFRDFYNMKLLMGKAGNISVCQNGVCCYLSYEKETESGDLFAFGTRDGIHPRHGGYYLQVCILLKCSNNNVSECGIYVKESSTRFRHVKITGTLTTRYIYPEILLYNSSTRLITLASPTSWSHQDGIFESNGFEHPLISASLLGRVYERDHVAANDAPEIMPSYVYFSYCILTGLVMTLLL